MKISKYILSGVTAVALAASFSSCGDSYLETKYYKGVDVDGALTSPELIQTALTGTYYNLYHYKFAGNYAVSIGDIPTDLTYWNTLTGHWDDLYQYSFDETDLYLGYIWEYGYKVVDNSARVIVAADALLANASDATKKALNEEKAEAYALRAYANLVMVNIFGHQVKVAGKDFSAQPGLVVSNEPIPALTNVERSSVGATYEAIVSDLKNSIACFDAAGANGKDKCVFTKAAAEGLLARAYLYLEDWKNAKAYAQAALTDAGVEKLTYTAGAYKALYNGEGSNTESFFYLSIDAAHNWSANSCGTLYSTYNFSPSPKLQALYQETDVRKAIQEWDKTSTADVPVYGGGKYAAFATANPANATCYLINAPEMYLIIAEAELNAGTVADAQAALLNVAKRNTAITTVADLPQTKDALYSFLKDERARELFQEGLRLWDLRRWGDKVSVEAYSAPEVKFHVNNYNISDLVYPIPADEINAGFGVAQNDWAKTLPAAE